MSGLGITCGDLRRQVGSYLGFDRDPANWGANETSDVWDAIDSGLRQFYRPGRLEGEYTSHQWSFLRPIKQMALQTSVEDYLMPEDFAGLDGGLYYMDEDSVTDRIQVCNEGRLLQLRQAYWHTISTFSPQYAAITPMPGDQLNQQRYKLMIWPIPDADYTLQFKYFARQDGLRSDSAVPVGGSEHAETILASCLAAAESRHNDMQGEKRALYNTQLQASIDFDRKANSPQSIGYNGGSSERGIDVMGYSRVQGGLVTLEAFPP